MSVTPDGSPDVTVVVLTWNGRHLLDPCLRALRAQQGVAFRTVVVDNASTDGTVAWLGREHPWAEVLVNPANLGFAGGNDAALREVTTPFVALLNNDAVPGPGWLAALVDALRADPTVAAATSRMLLEPTFAALTADGEVVGVTVDDEPVHPVVAPGRTTPDPARLLVPAAVGQRVAVTTATGTTLHDVTEAVDVVQNAGVVLLADGAGGDRGYGRPDGPAFDTPAEVFGACGGAVAYRTSAAAAVGWFDERWFLYYEDVDLSWRLRAAGHRVVYVPGAVVRHAHGASTPSAVHAFHDDRNRLLTLAVNAPTRLWLGETVRHPLVTLLLARRGAPVAHRVRAYRSYLTLLPGLLTTRARLGRSAVLTRDETAAWRTTQELWLEEGV